VVLRLWVFLFAAFLLGCFSKNSIERIDGSKIYESDLTNQILSLADSANVTGMAISIFNRNEVFYGASLSKAVFGYLVAQLVNEGIIDLDTPLQEFLEKPLPAIPFAKEWQGFGNLKEDKRYEKITARMCLSHTTGFPNWRWMNEGSKLTFQFDPGTKYQYSGEGFEYLKKAIENRSGSCARIFLSSS